MKTKNGIALESIKVGDSFMNPRGRVEKVEKITGNYVNNWLCDCITIVQELPREDIKKFDRLFSGKMSEREQDDFEGLIFGTYSKKHN